MLLVPVMRDTPTGARTGNRFVALLGLVLRLADLIMLVCGGVIAHRLWFGAWALEKDYHHTLMRSVLFGLIMLTGASLYRSWRGRGLRTELARLVPLWTIMFACMALYSTAVQQFGEMSRMWWLSWYVTSLALVCSSRIWVRRTAEWVREQGFDQRHAVIIGGNEIATRIIRNFQAQPWAGIDVQGWFSTPSDRSEVSDSPRLGDLEALADYVETHRIDEVWITLPVSAQHEIARAMELLRHSTADLKFVPDLFGMRLLNHSVEQIGGVPVINLQQSPLRGEARLLKALEDRVLAGLILLMIAPLMAVIAIAVKLSSPGPVFYRQERMSWNSKSFWMLKFRSMPVDAESGSGAVWARAGENRATKVGAFLRKTSLDELPQFLNVLKGDMSIVGPRPERPVFVHKFRDEVQTYMQKHMVKAGITGWAQVNGWRGSTDLQKRIDCDIHYIENWSLAFDLKIIFLTLFKGFVHRNAY